VRNNLDWFEQVHKWWYDGGVQCGSKDEDRQHNMRPGVTDRL